MSDCEDCQSESQASFIELEMAEVLSESGSHASALSDFAVERLPISRLMNILTNKAPSEGFRMSHDVLKTVKDATLLLLPVLRQSMNDCNSANRLPTEVLAMIFCLCMSKPDLETWPQSRLTSNRGLRTITHVCRYWRTVALATPLLWANIYDHPQLTPQRNSAPAFLRRSLHVPLNLYIAEAPSDLLRELIQEHPERIRQLYIKPRSYYDLDTISGLAPNVELLTMRRTSGKASFPRPNIFDEDTPRLTSVALTRVRHLPGSQLRSLTHLAIVDPGETSSWTASDLLSLLERNPGLEEVFLGGLPQVAPSDSESPSVIHLPHLRRLTLGECTHSQLLTFLLQHIEGSESAATLVHNIPKHTGRCAIDIPHMEPLSRLHLRAENDTMMTVTATDECSALRVERASVPFIFYSQDEDWLKRENRTDSLWVTWPLEELEELWVTGPSGSHNAKCLEIQGGIKTMLEQTTTLTTLTLAFLYNSEKPEPDLSLSWLLKDAVLDTCPETLSTLRLWIDAVPGSTSFLPVRDIMNFAARRQSSGCGLHRLVLEGGPNIGVRVEDVLDWANLASYVDLLEVRLRVEKPPEMTLPEVCQQGEHAFWPSWRS